MRVPLSLTADGVADPGIKLTPERSPNNFDATPRPNSMPDLLLWQLADSAFPTGGFAHSSGLEAAWQHGEVKDAVALESFLESSLRQFGHGGLPFMTSSHREPSRLLELDRLCESFTLNHVANRASRSQGRALLLSARHIFGLSRLEQPPFCHLAPLFGVVTRWLDASLDVASRLFLFWHLRGLIAAAVRLGIVGPLQAQALQQRFSPRAEEILQSCYRLDVDEIAQVSPLLDLWQGTHDRLYSRLFQT